MPSSDGRWSEVVQGSTPCVGSRFVELDLPLLNESRGDLSVVGLLMCAVCGANMKLMPGRTHNRSSEQKVR